MIFLYHSSSTDNEWQGSQLAFTHVCRLWRAIALETPRAWRRIHLDHDTHSEYISAVLRRSRDEPLDVVFAELCAVKQASTVLSEAMARIVSLRIDTYHLDSITERTPGPIQLFKLEHLDISSGARSIPTFLAFIGHLPMLHTLKFGYGPFNWSASSFTMMPAIRSLYLTPGNPPFPNTFQRILQALQKLRNLERFKFIPIVLLAPKISVSFKTALENGISSYMTTPCLPIDLGNALIPALEGRAAPSSAAGGYPRCRESWASSSGES